MSRRMRGRFHRSFNSQPTPVNLKNLFEQIRDEKLIVEQLASYWVCQYRESDSDAYHNLINFLLESMGFDKNSVSLSDLENLDMESVIAKITKKAKNVEDYPIVSKSKQFKTFYMNFQHFWIYLVTEASDLLYDESLLSFLSSWLSSLTFNVVKAVRHTATLAVLALAQALIDILMKESNDLIRVQTFIKTEMSNSDTQRLQLLQKQEQEIMDRQRTLNKELNDIYNEVIKVRSIDVIMEIRAICIQGLHYLADKLPEKFLTNETLTLLTYSLFDKSSDVRSKSLEFISNILNDENFPSIRPFLEENKLRILEMSHDIDNKICVLAINISSKLSKFMELTDEEMNIVACLVWADSEEIRNSACNFLLQAIFKDKLPLDHGLGTSLSIDQGKSYDWEKGIMKIVDFYKQFGESDICRVEIVVQTLWNKTSVVKSWEGMCELLKRGDKAHTTPLEEIDKKIILYILISGLKFICSSQEKKQKAIMLNLTSVLLAQLPGLLVYYSQDKQTLEELVKIPAFLDLSSLAAKDLKEPFIALLQALMDLQGKVKDSKIALKLIQNIVKLAREPHSMQKEAKCEVVKLVAEISSGLRESLKKFILECEDEGLQDWLTKGESLISVYDISDDLGEDSLTDLSSILSQYLSDSISNRFLAQHSSGVLFYYHLWKLNKISKYPESIESYISFRDSLIELYTALLAKPNSSYELKYYVFKYLCETLMVVSSHSAMGCPLYFDVNKDVWTTLEEFMLSSQVFQATAPLAPPSRAFFKYGAKDESNKEDADEVSQTICLLVSRIICFCPSITTSHLPSSFLAHFGTCSLKSINSIVRQVIVHYKTKESQQSGVFNDSALFFSIILESLIKAMGSGSDQEINSMKELARKFVNVMGQGAMRPKQADKLLGFVIDGISFAFSDKDNFAILDGLIVFLQKNYLSPNQMKELYERVSRDADTIENKIRQHHDGDINTVMYPIKHFLYNVSKVVGVARQPPVAPSEKTKKQIIKLREQLYKNKENEKEAKAIKKSAVRIADDESKTLLEREGDTLVVQNGEVDLPKKRLTESNDDGVRKSIKKSAVVPGETKVAAKKSGIRVEDGKVEINEKALKDLHAQEMMIDAEIGNKGSRDTVASLAREGKAGAGAGAGDGDKGELDGVKKTAIKKSVVKPIIKKSSIRLDEQMEETKMLVEAQPIPIIVKKY